MLHRRTHSKLRAALGAVALVGAPAAIAVATAGPASAGTFTVTTTADGGSGSLREAIETLAVNGSGDTVVLQPGALYQLTECDAGDLDHGNTPLVIEGNGATIEQTCEGDRVLQQGDAALELWNLTLTGGTDEPGAGVRSTGNLAVIGSTVTGNSANDLSAGGGIAAANGASLLLENSTVSGNTARNGGGVSASASSSVTVINSTITGNTARGENPATDGTGGAFDGSGGGTWIFTYATVVGNTAGSGGQNLSIGAEASISVNNSVIADGTCSLNGNEVTSTYSVTNEESCGIGGSTDVVVADPMLAPLGDYGGPTLTREPLFGSPVIGVVPPAECGAGQDGITTDQRGFPRPAVGVPVPDDGACDAGAVEYVLPTDNIPPSGPPPAPPVVETPRFTG